jgi:hypothetical protein
MPNSLPREEGAIMRYKDVIEQSNIKLPPCEIKRCYRTIYFKLPPLGGIPTELVFNSFLNLKEYELKNKAETSTSQS